ncbi:MAG: magnesium transporter, partial [Candidatus Acidiferrales bacterium]
MHLAERTAEIARLLQERNWRALREQLAHLPPPEGAELLLRLQKPERMLVFRSMPRDLAAEVFTHLEPHDRDALLRDLTDEETRQLLSSLSPDDRTHLLEELPGNVTRRLLNLLSPEDLGEARHLLGYPEESVGRMMTPDYAAVRPDWTAARALEHIRQLGKDTETINVVYVTARNGALVGQVELRRFILADPATPVDQIMDPNVVSLSANEDREKAVHTVERYDVNVIPVVDSGGVLLGIVTVDDVLDVAKEEVTEDFHKIATVEPIHVPLREAGVGLFYQRRIGWLLVLVFVNVLSGAGIAYYQETIARAITLVFFLPLLIASS